MDKCKEKKKKKGPNRKEKVERNSIKGKVTLESKHWHCTGNG
jgi:hypothetical protein